MTRHNAAATTAMLCLFWLCVASAANATGTAHRVWVSGHGVDQAGCGAPTAPCRSLQYAHDNVVIAGGEIDILDPAGYGAIAITKAVSIVNDGIGTAGIQATSGPAISINAGPGDTVFLKGLNIDGLGSASYGVNFLSGGALTVTNCVVRHFEGLGILLQPSGSSKILISNSALSDGASLSMVPDGSGSASLVIDHVTSNNNVSGFFFNTSESTGASQVLISNSLAENDIDGIYFFAGTTASLYAMIDMTSASNNLDDGLVALQSADVRISRSTFTRNFFGIKNSEAPNHVSSFNDNRIDGNTGGDVSGSPLLSSSYQ